MALLSSILSRAGWQAGLAHFLALTCRRGCGNDTQVRVVFKAKPHPCGRAVPGEDPVRICADFGFELFLRRGLCVSKVVKAHLLDSLALRP